MDSSGWCSDLEKRSRIGSLVMFQINLMSKIGEAHLNMLFSHISVQRCCMSSLRNRNITDAQDRLIFTPVWKLCAVVLVLLKYSRAVIKL